VLTSPAILTGLIASQLLDSLGKVKKSSFRSSDISPTSSIFVGFLDVEEDVDDDAEVLTA